MESEEQRGKFHTYKVQYPPKDDFYFDMSEHMTKVGAPFHNVSDTLRQYAFENVEKLNIVIIG